MRDANHYRKLLATNRNAAVGFTLAAAAVYAARFGACEAEHHSTPEYRAIARDLKARHGETLTAQQVEAEMRE